MRPGLAVLAALMILLAGCTVGSSPATTVDDEAASTETPGDTTSANGRTPTDSAEDSETPGSEETVTETPTDETDGGSSNYGASDDGTAGGTSDGNTDIGTSDGNTDGDTSVESPYGGDSDATDAFADPDTDRLGWEAGLWYNQSIDVDNSDGMNSTEQDLAVARSMARVEHVRRLEFPGNETIPISVKSREEFRQDGFGQGNYSQAYRTFENGKFEALFFVGENENSLTVQKENRGSSVLGYYSPSNDSIVLISEGDLPQFDGEETLAQEVAHALQDQVYNTPSLQANATTRDGYAGLLGIIEGDGNLIDSLYVEECDRNWSCIPAPETSGGGNSGPGENFHYGIYFMQFLPYSDGPGFVQHYYDRGGWDRVDEIYGTPPASSEQVVFPEKYQSDPPTNVTIADRTSESWERVSAGGQSFDRLGMGAMAAMFMYTSYDSYNESSVVSPFSFLNYGESGVSTEDPIDYAIDAVNGWEGDRIQIYRSDNNQTGYVWKSAWESAANATEFADAYDELLVHWGAESVGDRRYVLPEESPYTDAIDVRVDGDTVIIVNAPTTEGLSGVYAPAG